jgi:gamma-tubulin complex component 3
VLHGELRDPYREFFVATAGNGARLDHFDSSSADFVWHSYYNLQPSMLPAFISHKLATKILVVGKSINFMKACVRHGGKDEGGSRMDRDKNKATEDSQDEAGEGSSEIVLSLSSKFEKSLQALQYGHELELEGAVFSVATVIETRLLQMILNKFHLTTHLSALKKFLLLGQVDFDICPAYISCLDVGRFCDLFNGQHW